MVTIKTKISIFRSLSDRNTDQKLDKREYSLAMFLISQKQGGAVLPAQLPKNLIYSIYPEEMPEGASVRYLIGPI